MQVIRISFLFLLSVLLAFFPLFSAAEPAFAAGEYYILYLNSASSQATVYFSDCPAWDKLIRFDVAGESTVYAGDRSEALLCEYDAEILFSETVGNVTSYYCRSSRFRGGIHLNGVLVNLQIAVSEEQTAVGTPLIFGGF